MSIKLIESEYMPVSIPPANHDEPEPLLSHSKSLVVDKTKKKIEQTLSVPSQSVINSSKKKLKAALTYLETDPNAISIWNALTDTERPHIERLLQNHIQKNQDPQIHNLYGAIDILTHAHIDLCNINSLKSLYTKSKQINTENDTKKLVSQYVMDLCGVLGEEYSILWEDKQPEFRWALTDTIWKCLNKWLHQAVVDCLGIYAIPLPIDETWKPIQITRTYLGGLNTTQPTREIGKLKSTAFPYTLYALQSKAEMQKESGVLDHCVGKSDFYMKKVLKWEILILSLRDSTLTPHWTIEYDTKKRSIVKFKWWGHIPVNSIPGLIPKIWGLL